MNRRSGQAFILAGIGLILGLLVSLQLKNVQAAGGSVSLERIRELNERIAALQQGNAEMELKIAGLEAQAAERKELAERAEAQVDELESMLETLRMKAGLTELSGPGVIVTVRGRTAESGETLTFVTDTDLLYLVNELRAAGAEAIAVNGRRLGAGSEIRAAGAYISVGGYATAAPYAITALGDAQALSSALNLYGGVVDMLAGSYDIEVTRQNGLIVPACDVEPEFRFAQPVGEDAP